MFWPLAARTLGLWLAILLSAYGWGQSLRHGLRIAEHPTPPGWWLGVGLGILAWVIGLAGFVPGGWHPAGLALLLLTGWALLWRYRPRVRGRPAYLRLTTPPLRLWAGLTATVLVVAWLWAWAPPWSYDALMYHLDGPRRLLQHGRWALLPEVWTFNTSYLVQMLYLVGLALGSDLVAKLLAWTFGLLLLLLVADWAYGLYRRADAVAWSVAWLLSIPLFGTWMHWAYVDIPWSFFLVGSAYALWRWQDAHTRAWLRLSGWLIALALLTKLLAVGAFLVLGLTLGASLRRSGAPFVSGMRHWGRPVILLLLPMLAKNSVLSGNPIYPFVWGGPGAPPELLAAFNAYMHSYGWGKGWLRYITWPWAMFRYHRHYATFWGILEYPPPFGWLVYLWPWKHAQARTRPLAVWAAGWALFWSIGSQQIRFLLPVFALVALLLTDVLLRLVPPGQSKWLWRLAWLTTGMALAFTLLPGIHLRPWRWWAGQESRSQLLSRMVPNYAAWEFIQQHLAPTERVLFMWNWQGYYCDNRCQPDVAQHTWSLMVQQAGDAERLLRRLRARGFTHLLYSGQDVRFLVQHDPQHVQRNAHRFFVQDFAPRCTTVTRAWPRHAVVLYRLREQCLPAATPGPSEGSQP